MGILYDIYDQWCRHEDELNKQLENRPVCVDCDNPIQDDEGFYINGEWICESCMDAYRRNISDYFD